MTPEAARAIGEKERDERFEALAHERRRQVLHVLRLARERLSLTDLAIEVSRRDSTAAEIGAECEEVKQVRATLYHWHVPKLADVELVDYDTDHNMVEPTTEVVRADEVADLLVLPDG